MTKHILITAVSAASLAATSLAGVSAPAPDKNPVAPTPVYGTGWYGGLQLGMNAYQDYGGTRRTNFRGNSIALEANENIGFVGGLKLGYVFGTGTVRPALEADVYYNGVKADLDLRVNGNDTGFNAEADLNSVAFMGNFLLRFAFDRFQPYIGAGAGWYVSEANNVDVTIRGRTRSLSDGSGDGFAWQLIAGADYYWTEKVSTYLEYKFLNYEDAGIAEDRIGQQIIVLGVRWHF